jgi:DNA-binding transcriptional LysR family regulator
MNHFKIPPDYARILNALSQTPSLREAAKLLHLDPAALTRKVQKISDEHGLIYKSAQKWIISEKGRLFISWANESIARLDEILEEDLSINISAYTWMAEQVLLPNFKKLNQLIPDCSWFIKTNSVEIEKEIIKNVTDFAITRYPPTDPSINYKKILIQPWVIVLPEAWRKNLPANSAQIRKELDKLPYIRMANRNAEDILSFEPQIFSNLMVDGFIGIRTAVSQGIGWSCLPKASVSLIERKGIHTVELPGVTKDSICLWWLRSRKDLLPLTKKLIQWLDVCFEE